MVEAPVVICLKISIFALALTTIAVDTDAKGVL